MRHESQTDTAIAAENSQRWRPSNTLRRVFFRPFVSAILASFGIFGGISALFIGLVCAVLHGVVSNDRVFDRASTVLLVVAIPMILLGALFVDEVDPKN